MKIRSLYKGKILNENDIQKNTHFQTRMSQAVKYENEIHLVSIEYPELRLIIKLKAFCIAYYIK